MKSESLAQVSDVSSSAVWALTGKENVQNWIHKGQGFTRQVPQYFRKGVGREQGVEGVII